MYHGRVKEHQSSPPWFWNCRNRSIQLIERQREELPHKVGAGLTVSKVLVRDKNKKREGIDPSVLTDQWEDIITDDEIQIVVEVMGGNRTRPYLYYRSSSGR